MTDVTLLAVDPAGNPVPRARYSFEPYPDPSFTASGALVEAVRGRCALDGTASVTLMPTDDLTPDGALYRVRLNERDIGYIEVPASGTHALLDLITDPPASPQSAALSLHERDHALHPPFTEFVFAYSVENTGTPDAPAPDDLRAYFDGEQIVTELRVGGKGPHWAEQARITWEDFIFGAVPLGGTGGQVLTKIGSEDLSFGWADLPGDVGDLPGGGTTGQILAKASNADFDTTWIDPPEGGGGDFDPLAVEGLVSYFDSMQARRDVYGQPMMRLGWEESYRRLDAWPIVDDGGHAPDFVRDETPSGRAAVVFSASLAPALLTPAFPEGSLSVYTVLLAAKITGGSYACSGGAVADGGTIGRSGGNFIIYNGLVLSGGAADSDWHVFVGIFDGASSKFRIDGVEVASGDTGASGIDRVTLGGYGASQAAPADCEIAGHMVIDGDATAILGDLEAWAMERWLTPA